MSFLRDPLGLVSEGTKIDFQLQINSYLYGTRFMMWLAHTYTPEKLIEWVRRQEGSRAYYSRHFRQIYGRSLETAWADWILWEQAFQQKNLAAIRQQGEDYRPTRRSPRKRVPMLDAIVNSAHARIVDVSYEGLRLQVEDDGGGTLPPYFMVQIPTFNLTCRAQRVWTSPAADDHGVWCGATLVGEDPVDAVAWRTLVDSVPGWTLLAH